MNPQSISWFLLAASVAAEVAGTVALRYADGFSRATPSLIVVACYAGAIWLMSLAVKHLELGLSYAVWAGSGTALTAVLGVLCFDESATVFRITGLILIVLGVAALNLSAR